MPIVFKYKNPINISYAPGRANIGENGETGRAGEAGNALYFTNLELDNSYNIELTLQKIENNVILSSSSIGSTTNIREYKVNDLILSRTGKCYKIVQSTSSSLFKNYKYDIEYLGKFRTKSSVNAVRAVFRKINDNDKHYPVPTNKTLIKNTYNDNDYKLRTLQYEVKLYGIEYSPDNFYSSIPGNDISEEEKDKRETAINSIANGENTPYRYSLQIRLKNTKQLCLNAFPGTIEELTENKDKDKDKTGGLSLSFYKTIEIPAVDLFKDDFYISADSSTYNDSLKEYCQPTVFTISDSMLDRLHPSKNNVQCTLNNDKDMWYKTGLLAEDKAFNVNSFKLSETAQDECNNIEEKYGSSTTYIELKNRTFVENGEIRKVDYNNLASAFPKYSFPTEKETESSSIAFQDDIYNNLESIKEKELTEEDSKLLIKDRNILPGTSLYFSSIEDDDLCKKEMENFLFSQNTSVYVIAKNLRTKEIVVSEVPFEIEDNI